MLMVLLSLQACLPADQAVVLSLPELELNAAELNFGSVPIGQRASLPLALVNTWYEPRVLRCSAPSPFSVDTPLLELEAEGSAVLLVSYTAELAGLSGSSETLRCDEVNESGFAIPLSGQTDPDGDADGFESTLAGGPDCDDQDPSVHPDADDACYDGVDQDCDGSNEQDCDGDGWELAEDCDDADARINPSAPETWYDGVDQDCSGDSDFDRDHDGFDREPEGPDCDDTRDYVNPDVIEVWYDGLDADCSGGSDFDQDGDGLDLSPWGLDCDDQDAGIGACEPG
ncbi:MAG: MopE-related protein [Myxococcota bacterium]|nr:MopE-related protein [Myxococcota bacterium]